MTGRVVGVQATYRPCVVCHRPALVLVDGEVVTPYVIELGWDDYGDPVRRFLGRMEKYATPHEEGCSEIRPDHPEGRYIFVPGEAIASSGVGFDGVRLDGPGPAADHGTEPDVAPSNGAGGDDRPAPPEGTKEGTK